MKSSAVAVPSIATVIIMNNGFNNAEYISLSETRFATRSVTGNSNLSIHTAYQIVGMSMTAIIHCQLSPIFPKAKATNDPITIPPGNQR